MNNLSAYLSEFTQGILYLVFGFFLFLYATGLLTRYINVVIVLVAIGIMVYGFMKANLHSKLMAMLEKKPKK